LAILDQDQEIERLGGLRDRLQNHLSTLPNIHLNGHPTQRLPNNLNISIEGVKGTTLLSQLQPHIALSSGSACSAANPAPSHVIKALGRSDELARATLRFGLGRSTTAAEIDRAGETVIEKVQKCRKSFEH
jgi:cysteine desulfurase